MFIRFHDTIINTERVVSAELFGPCVYIYLDGFPKNEPLTIRCKTQVKASECLDEFLDLLQKNVK